MLKCQGKTKTGKPCGRKIDPKSDKYCWQHLRNQQTENVSNSVNDEIQKLQKQVEEMELKQTLEQLQFKINKMAAHKPKVESVPIFEPEPEPESEPIFKPEQEPEPESEPIFKPEQEPESEPEPEEDKFENTEDTELITVEIEDETHPILENNNYEYITFEPKIQKMLHSNYPNYSFVRMGVPPNGSCFFYSILYLIDNSNYTISPELISRYRSAIFDNIQQKDWFFYQREANGITFDHSLFLKFRINLIENHYVPVEVANELFQEVFEKSISIDEIVPILQKHIPDKSRNEWISIKNEFLKNEFIEYKKKMKNIEKWVENEEIYYMSELNELNIIVMSEHGELFCFPSPYFSDAKQSVILYNQDAQHFEPVFLYNPDTSHHIRIFEKGNNMISSIINTCK